MGMFKYALRVASGMRFKKLGQCIDRVHEKCGKNKAATFFDMMWCAARYGAGYYDYLIFGFYAMNGKQRDTYVTRMRNKKLITRLNNQEHSYLFENKGE
ncbi:MAG: carboxylate--amine ligase, partial [Clostridia bacterium]|nr:carboxylate--amine ligase [Clostridia bacterium]